jgi:hypothetical protein
VTSAARPDRTRLVRRRLLAALSVGWTSLTRLPAGSVAASNGGTPRGTWFEWRLSTQFATCSRACRRRLASGGKGAGSTRRACEEDESTGVAFGDAPHYPISSDACHQRHRIGSGPRSASFRVAAQRNGARGGYVLRGHLGAPASEPDQGMARSPTLAFHSAGRCPCTFFRGVVRLGSGSPTQGRDGGRDAWRSSGHTGSDPKSKFGRCQRVRRLAVAFVDRQVGDVRTTSQTTVPRLRVPT